ncbi:TIGR01620 family protein [uncultured Bartonella sp.]|uniref:YcjF family protein n=1 Tax=uncultured Bartonella sp. TaxID=104108 RepID=UPI002616320B|nr:TIGR01620 family protein [uncultured Bartonella sp.]
MNSRKPQAINDLSSIAQDQNDPFLQEALGELDNLDITVENEKKYRFTSGKIFVFSLLLLLVLSLSLWVDGLIRSLFSHYKILGIIALVITIVGIVALFLFVLGEIRALMRLASVDKIRQNAEKATQNDDINFARQSVEELIRYTAHSPYVAKGHNTMKTHRQDIIDGKALIHLAEYEILRPLDTEARKMILNSAKRVSVVTAVSPRAIIDLGYVLYEVVGLIRRLATLYGARPERFGLISLVKRVISHLAVTGTLAIGDGLVEQFIGQGLATRLSARLGEGVVNGLMTTRIGIATMDALRPFPFDGEKRPGISDFTGDLIGFNLNKKQPKAKKTLPVDDSE